MVLALLRSAQTFHRAIGPTLRSADLTASQWDVLETLHTKGALTVNQLMVSTLGTSGNVDVVVKNLIRSGFVRKELSPSDGRVRIVKLTTAGKEKVSSFIPMHNQALNSIFGRLTSEDRRRIVQMLNHLRKMMLQPEESRI